MTIMNTLVYKNLTAHTLVVHPPISEYDTAIVSKIFANDVLLNHERQITYHIRHNINFPDSFAIQPIKYNYIDASEMKIKLNMSDCDYKEFMDGKMDSDLDNKIVEVLYPYGGLSLDAFNPYYRINRREFMKAWKSLFYGLTEMYGKICHNDIKPGNIVYDNQTNQMRFIDFGSAMIVNNNKNYRDTIYNSIGSFQNPQYYQYWAPEVAILVNYSEKCVKKLMNFYTTYPGSYFKICHNLLGREDLIIEAQQDFVNLNEFIHNKTGSNYNKHQYKQHIMNADMYSLGISLGLSIMKTKIKVNPKDPICNLIAKMICVDYRKRITPKEAYAEFCALF